MISIIDYRAGNAPSVSHAISHLGYDAQFAHHSEDLAKASHIILPGVGSAGATMQSLRDMGLIEALEEAVLHRGAFFLGICVGLQILFEHSDEGDVPCLGWFDGKVVKFDSSRVRVPQIGWNQVSFIKNTPISPYNEYFYFVNSYYAIPSNQSDVWAQSDYNGVFTAAVCRDNIYAAQFHIEKSGESGLSILKSFLNLKKGV